MTTRAANSRRAASRTRTDENAVPSQTLRSKPSLSSLGPAQKVGVTVNQGKKVGAKVGAKRTVLGGVVGNGVKDDVEEGKKALKPTTKTILTETRQPLQTRNNNVPSTVPNGPSRVIAPVPHRAKPTSVHVDAPMPSDDLSEMDVDTRRPEVLSREEDESSLVGSDEEEDDEEDEDDWLRLPEDAAAQVEEELALVRNSFKDDVDMFDTTMVAEYADEIFQHMENLEQSVMPNPRYMDFQTEIEWTMRSTLIDWLLQVHLRYHMLPETLWIAVNLVDRFLSVRVVSLVKLQLVGVTAMFIAAKYEEILAPSVEEFVFMTESGYTKDEILKGERIILQTLDFTISSYCSPYSWVRRISKADDYDIQTRTLSKFLMEVTLLDHRFLRCRPSMIAAVGMYLARRMLNGDWNDAFVYYSGFTEVQLVPGAMLLCERLVEPSFEGVYAYKKYSNKKFLRASTFAREWAMKHAPSSW
ncbi:hypothetical protein TREMEDRAFT_40507 [Tremella mesenterica DSM 1558]|uniref:uncharacterized protein n=1 Tax=Tremella mesenterica (strain ATCC 24925 / CBS 8224 / DSM 1558 / NBRC 9311 / NRRL Y-6157 / RJB 2259-6 / UBC 559-6) TaxID=578456 RepID=UPI0003F49258|nr:uncharacterized protein TREMEDRAFT_40507 [Tremella mesenterica DSM 1558]EIW67370.1 hypothetical protein TREMEDRAFT_40507 [Tremella mesenterica DSM 1558]